ncbi:hypothetical protein [Lactobacillus kitasatonis]|uniref:hypothetical protein n=1 Tax=Lactobacillus kitasatonis TaxID=237446 RepID=UPI000468A6F2|nr:hypothetical protein [Lactobacillus kitasatonis]
MSNTTVVVSAYKFFNKYFDRILSISGLLPLDLMPENLSNIKPSDDESYPQRIIQAETIAYCIASAINECKDEPRKPYKTILIDVYLKEISNIETMKEVGYEHSRYAVLKRQAVDEFAGRFNVYAIKSGVGSIIELSQT